MLIHDYLYDPITRTEDMKFSEFTKYIKMRDKQLEKGTAVSKKVIDAIRGNFYESHSDLGGEKLGKCWKYIYATVKRNSALAQFVLDYGGAESDFFFPWLISVATSPSAALEMAYGAGYNLRNEWVVDIPEDDNINFFVRNVPTFVYNRERQLFVADLVSSIQDKGTTHNPTKVVDLGAGMLAWARWHGFKFDANRQHIIAYDKDKNIVPTTLFEQPLEQLGLSYFCGDLREAFFNENSKEADLMILGGVASYLSMEAFAASIIMPVYGFLNPGGVFFFDLQLQCPQYEWTVKLFDWPEMNLAKSPEAAIHAVESVRRDLWQKGLKFGADYKVDTCNEMPSAVMITFTKI